MPVLIKFLINLVPRLGVWQC